MLKRGFFDPVNIWNFQDQSDSLILLTEIQLSGHFLANLIQNKTIIPFYQILKFHIQSLPVKLFNECLLFCFQVCADIFSNK